MKHENINYVAVFGTLKHNHCANDMLGGSQAPFLLGETIQTYDMTDVGFPYICKNVNGSPVLVHVYEVSDDILAALDRYEGTPHHYTRELCDVWIPSTLSTLENVYIYEAVTMSGNVIEELEGILCWNIFFDERKKEILQYMLIEEGSEEFFEDARDIVPRNVLVESIGSSVFNKTTIVSSPFQHRIQEYVKEDLGYSVWS